MKEETLRKPSERSEMGLGRSSGIKDNIVDLFHLLGRVAPTRHLLCQPVSLTSQLWPRKLGARRCEKTLWVLTLLHMNPGPGWGVWGPHPWHKPLSCGPVLPGKPSPPSPSLCFSLTVSAHTWGWGGGPPAETCGNTIPRAKKGWGGVGVPP